MTTRLGNGEQQLRRRKDTQGGAGGADRDTSKWEECIKADTRAFPEGVRRFDCITEMEWDV